MKQGPKSLPQIGVLGLLGPSCGVLSTRQEPNGPSLIRQTGDVLGSQTATEVGFISVAEAADRLNVPIWDVMRLAERGAISTRLLVSAADVDALKEQQ